LQTFQISDFREHQHYGPTIADRVWNAWWRNAGHSASDVERHMIEMADERPLPMAFVAHNDRGYLGSAFLIHSDMEERTNYGPCRPELERFYLRIGWKIIERAVGAKRLSVLKFDLVARTG
jgi:hypothetical protein